MRTRTSTGRIITRGKKEDMSFEARQSTVGKLLNDSIYRIPRNQRAYVWDEHNWRDLFEDIKLVTEGVASSHFIGSIVLMEEDEEDSLDVFTIIDGQQRVITLTLLLASLMFAFKKRGMISDAGGTKKYLVAKDTKDLEHVIVAPDNHLTLERIVKGVIEISPQEAGTITATAFAKSKRVSTKDNLIVKAFQYFSNKFASMEDDELLSFRDAVISVSYVNIKSSTEEDSYTIFEILNARGLELEDHELLKNYIMRYIHPAEKRDDAKKIWSEIEAIIGTNMKPFLRHYAIQKYRLSNGDKDGAYKKIRDYTDPKTAADLLYDLRQKADYYAEIINPTTQDHNAEILSFLKAHNVRVFRPLLMSLMHAHDLERINDDEYNDALEFIYRFYICYKIIGGMESNHLTDSIVKHSFAIEINCTEEAINEWKKSFREKLPSRETYKTNLRALGWSHVWPVYSESKYKERCKLVLTLLEELKSGAKVSGEYTIEHVLPDSASQENALIGNLLPLEKNLNEKCKNKALKEKLPIYAKSRFCTTRAFAKRYSTSKFDILNRIDFMAADLFKLIENE